MMKSKTLTRLQVKNSLFDPAPAVLYEKLITEADTSVSSSSLSMQLTSFPPSYSYAISGSTPVLQMKYIFERTKWHILNLLYHFENTRQEA